MSTLPAASVKALLDCGALHPAHAGAFARLEPDAQAAIARLFGTARFTMQRQRELIEWLPEIACRENATVSQVLACAEAQAVVAHDKANAPQVVQRLHDTLRVRRFPRLCAMRAEWERTARRVNPNPRRVTFTAPEAFERDGLEVTVRAQDEKELARLLEQLAAVREDQWRKLVRPAAPATERSGGDCRTQDD